MPKFRVLPAGDTSPPKAGIFRRASASGGAGGDAFCAPLSRERGFGPVVRSPRHPKRSISLERRSCVEADVTSRVAEVCWVSLIGKATDRFGELEGSNPFTQLQIVAPPATQNPRARFAQERPFVSGCPYEAALIQILKKELPDPHREGLRMQ